MGLHVNRNLALEAFPAIVAPDQSEPETRDTRAELAALCIPAGARVLDLGDNAALRALIPGSCAYTSCAPASDFPTQQAVDSDIIVMLGSLETVAATETLFTHLRFCRRNIVLSYHPTDLGAGRDRASRGFVNHFSFCDLTLLFDRYGFRIECTTPVDEQQVLMRLTPTERLRPALPSSVAVISGSDTPSFGDRLGYHMINALLPGDADIHHLTFNTLAQAKESYDLVVVGLGNSLFRPLLDDNLLDVVSRGKAAVGLFGTQYRELIPRPAMDRLIGRLDTWFARHEDDVLLYGRGRNNVVHLGDWLIDQFPMNKATLDEPLQIDDEAADELALDRTIQAIQQHRQVYSTQLAPLLCALTSAEMAAFAERPASDTPGIVSGKFRSMLIDIFGRSYAEKKFFLVDRDAVLRYKVRVRRNIASAGEHMGALLRNVAVAAV